MISSIKSNINNNQSQTSFTGYGSVVRKSYYKIDEKFADFIILDPSASLLEKTSSYLKKSPKELKSLLNISEKQEKHLETGYSKLLDDIFKFIDSQPANASDEDIAEAMVKKELSWVLNRFKKLKWINKNNEFDTIPARLALIKKGTDFIDDNLTSLADKVIIKGNVAFDYIDGNFVAINGMKNRKLTLNTSSAYVKNSTVKNIFTEFGAYGENIKAQNVESGDEVIIKGKNRIRRILSENNICLESNKGFKAYSNEGSIKIEDESEIEIVDAEKSIESLKGLKARKINAEKGSLILKGKKNSAKTIEAESKIYAENLTAEEMTSYKNEIELGGEKNEVLVLKAKSGMRANNLSGDFASTEFGSIILNGDKNNVNTVLANFSIIAKNLTAKIAQATNFIYLLGAKNNVEEIKTLGTLIGHKLTYKTIEGPKVELF